MNKLAYMAVPLALGVASTCMIGTALAQSNPAIPAGTPNQNQTYGVPGQNPGGAGIPGQPYQPAQNYAAPAQPGGTTGGNGMVNPAARNGSTSTVTPKLPNTGAGGTASENAAIIAAALAAIAGGAYLLWQRKEA